MAQRVIKNWNQMAVNKRRTRVEPKFPCVDTVLSDGQWKDEPCVIIGGGPSVKKIAHRVYEFPNHVHLAGANQAWKFDPAPELVYAIDAQVFDRAENGDHKDLWTKLSEWGQIRATHQSNAIKGDWPNTYWIRQISHRHWGDKLATGIISASNTGLALLNLVDVLGASPIILLGFDASSEGKNLNYHNDYPEDPGWRPRDPETTFDKWRKMCKDVGGKARGVVLNANPDSAWPVFDKVTFDEALELCKKPSLKSVAGIPIKSTS